MTATETVVEAVVFGTIFIVLGVILILPPRRYHYPIWRMPMGCGMFLGGLVILTPVLTLLLYKIPPLPPLVLRIGGIIVGLVCLIIVLIGVIGTCLFIWEYRKCKKLDEKNGDEMINQRYTSSRTIRTTSSKTTETDLLDEPETRRNLEHLEKRLAERAKRK